MRGVKRCLLDGFLWVLSAGEGGVDCLEQGPTQRFSVQRSTFSLPDPFQVQGPNNSTCAGTPAALHTLPRLAHFHQRGQTNTGAGADV
jgi:hypothetical protein